MLPKVRRGMLACLFILMGCATGEGIGPGDGTAGAAQAGSAGSGIGGGKTDFPGGTGGISVAGAGGASAGAGGSFGGSAGAVTGGAPGTGAGTGSGGTAACNPGEKKCGGLCVPPSPGVGCDATACSPCAAVPNGNLKCSGTTCDFDCVTGYTKSGSSCVPQSGTGGSPGTGGTTGTGGGGGGCALPCNWTDPSNQLVCTAACLLSGQNFGLCTPFNCCTCT